MYNTLRARYEPVLPALVAVMADEVGRPDAYHHLAEAISAGDPVAARQAAQDLLESATSALVAALDRRHAPTAKNLHAEKPSATTAG
jgi:GntR family transcriptional regulator, transcriptional repressor for pyruvate dehydrogenase complex